MKLDTIAKKLKANGFVEVEYRKGRLVHPENSYFIVNLYYDYECEEIEIGDFRNYASIPVFSIKSVRVESKPDGIEIEMSLYNDSGEMHLLCAFE